MALDTIVVDYQLELGNLKSQITELANLYKQTETAGRNSADKIAKAYAEQSQLVKQLQAQLVELKKAKDASDDSAAIRKQNEEIEKQKGILTGLRRQLEDLNQAREKAESVEDIKKYNTEIATATNRIKELTTEEKKETGIINQLKASVLELTKARDASNDPKEVQEFNKKLDESNAKIKQLSSSTQETEKSTTSFKDRIKQIGAVLLTAFAVEKVIEFAKVSYEAYAEAEAGEQKLLMALNGRVDAQQELLDLANKMQATTKFEDDAVIASEAFLAAQGRTTEQIKKTINAAAQLSTITGDDLQSSVEKLDATMETGLVGRLSKVVGETKNLTAEQIKNGAAIDVVAEKYKGFAENALNTTEGRMAKLKNDFNNTQEAVGGFVASLVNSFSPALDKLTNKATEFLNSMSLVAKGVTNVGGAEDYRSGFAAENDRLQKFLKTMTNSKGEVLSTQQAINALQDGIAKTQQKIDNASSGSNKSFLIGYRDATEKVLESLKVKRDEAAKQEEESNETTIKGIQNKIQARKQDLETAIIGSQKQKDLVKEISDLEGKLATATGQQTDAQKKKADQDKKDSEDTKKALQLEIQLRQELQQLQGKAESDPLVQAAKERDAAKQALEDKYKELGATQDLYDAEAQLDQIYQNKVKEINAKSLSDTQDAEMKADKDAKDAREQDYADAKAKIEASTEDREKALKQELAAAQQYGIDNTEIVKELAELKKKKDEEELERKKQLHDQEISLLKQAADAAFDIAKNISDGRLNALDKEHQDELDKLEKQKDAKKINDKNYAKEKQKIDDEYNAKASAEKTKQAKLDKEKALFDVVINTAVAITKASPNPVLIALAAATGVIEAAVIASRPIPKFKKGTPYLNMGTPGGDDALIYANKGERIIPTEDNKKYWGPLESMRIGKFSDDYISASSVAEKMHNMARIMDEVRAEKQSQNIKGVAEAIIISQKQQMDLSPVVQAINKNSRMDQRDIKALGSEIGKNFKGGQGRWQA